MIGIYALSKIIISKIRPLPQSALQFKKQVKSFPGCKENGGTYLKFDAHRAFSTGYILRKAKRLYTIFTRLTGKFSHRAWKLCKCHEEEGNTRAGIYGESYRDSGVSPDRFSKSHEQAFESQEPRPSGGEWEIGYSQRERVLEEVGLDALGPENVHNRKCRNSRTALKMALWRVPGKIFCPEYLKSVTKNGHDSQEQYSVMGNRKGNL